MTKEVQEITATGRRKRAVAAVRLRPGKGTIEVNGRPFETYFPLQMQRDSIFAPLEMVQGVGKYDMIVRVAGGGLEGQAIATRLGITRALVKESQERRSDFKAEGYLTRDPRRKERKKYGHKKARKSFQFSKR